MPRIIGVPGSPPGGGVIGVTVNAPPIAAPPVEQSGTDCACADLAMVWGENGLTALSVAITEDESRPAVAVATGDICPGAEWTVDIEWSGDEGDTPVVSQVGTAGWSVTYTVAGDLTLTFHALCAGVEFLTNAITLEITTDELCIADVATALATYDVDMNPISDTANVTVPTFQEFSQHGPGIYVGGDVLGGFCCDCTMAVGVDNYTGDPIHDGGVPVVGVNTIVDGAGCFLQVIVGDVWFTGAGQSGTYDCTVYLFDIDSNPLLTIPVHFNVSS